MAAEPGYSGVLYSSEVAGYTGGEGYTGIAPVPTSAEDAPVSTKPAPPTDEALAREFGILRPAPSPRPGATPSPADAVVVDRGKAPGQEAAVTISPPPPAPDAGPPPDPQAAAEADASQTAAIDEESAARGAALSAFATAAVQAQQRAAARPEPRPNEALAQARAVLERGFLPELRITPFAPVSGLTPLQGIPSGLEWPQDLLGPGADRLRAVAADVVARSRPTILGIAYLQGVALGMFNTAIGLAETTASQFLRDPLSLATGIVLEPIRQIDEHLARGESVWEAVNAVLNPLTRVRNQAWLANELAGAALVASEAGDWDLAVQRARDAGQATAAASLATVETALLAFTGARGVGGLRGRLRSPRTPTEPPVPPPPPTRPRPAQPDGSPLVRQPPATPEIVPIPVTRQPRPDGVTGKAYRNGAQRLPARPLSRPHPAEPRLPVYDSDYVRFQRELQKGATDYERGVALAKQERLPPDQRLREGAGSRRLANAKKVFNELERQTALESAVANPGHGYLLQTRIVGVRLRDGRLVPVAQINRTLGKTRGRIADYLDVAPDGTYTLSENKRWTALLASYSEGGLTGSRIKPGSAYGGQLARETNVFDYARRNGGEVVVEGATFEGRKISLELDPAGYRGSAPAPYLWIPE